MIRSFLIVLLLFCSQQLQAVNTGVSNKAIPNSAEIILILGDSISAAYGIKSHTGWSRLLGSKLTQAKMPYQVVNSSISGDTTINGLNRLKPLLDKYRPKVVIIELGGNDGLRGLSINVMKSNLKRMIEMCQQKGSRVLLAGMKIPPNYGKRYTQAFYQVYTDLSKEYSVELIPFLLEGVGGVPGLMQDDGIHPNEKAQPLILNIVWKKLQAML